LVPFPRILSDGFWRLGLILRGGGFGGAPLGAALAFAWVGWPFSQYASSSNTKDAIPPAFLIWGFLGVTHAPARAAGVALSAWTKFASLLVVPLWAGYPDTRRVRPMLVFYAWFLAVTAVVFFVLFLYPSPFPPPPPF